VPILFPARGKPYMKPTFISNPPLPRPGHADLSLQLVIHGGGVALVPPAIRRALPAIITSARLDGGVQQFDVDNGR
jgi:hypothetical protein